MRMLSLAVAALFALVVAFVAPSLAARSQNAPRFEYLRVTPFQSVSTTPGQVTSRWAGYGACVATSSDWKCRRFEGQGTHEALRAVLAGLGDEGWELVSAVDERHERSSSFGGLTYLFKRQKQ